MSSAIMFSKSEREFLNIQRVCRIATVDFSNYSHVVPICFVFDGGSFWTTVSRDGKRVRNVNRGSKVSILVDEYEERSQEWIILRGLLINCEATLLNHRDNKDQFMKGWRLLIEKYPQYKQWANADLTPKDPDRRIIMQLVPTKKTSWGFGSSHR